LRQNPQKLLSKFLPAAALGPNRLERLRLMWLLFLAEEAADLGAKLVLPHRRLVEVEVEVGRIPCGTFLPLCLVQLKLLPLGLAGLAEFQ
jgi:hypothetical protein